MAPLCSTPFKSPSRPSPQQGEQHGVPLLTGNGKLEPPKSDAAARADFLQWTISAEPGLTAGIADFFWHTMQFPEEKRKPQVAERGKEA